VNSFDIDRATLVVGMAETELSFVACFAKLWSEARHNAQLVVKRPIIKACINSCLPIIIVMLIIIIMKRMKRWRCVRPHKQSKKQKKKTKKKTKKMLTNSERQSDATSSSLDRFESHPAHCKHKSQSFLCIPADMVRHRPSHPARKANSTATLKALPTHTERTKSCQ
jgi:hypothetical protein